MSKLNEERVKLVDVAALAGVSTATVSRVLNARTGVAPANRTAVLRAMDQLGYERPERLAQRTEGLIGLVIPELINPVFPAFAQEIESVLAERGYTPLLCAQSPGGTTEDSYIEMLLAHQVRGVIFVSGLHADVTASHARYQRLRDRGLPLVMVNGFTHDVDAVYISSDDAAAVELAYRHLSTLGHTRIGLAVGPERFVPTRRKIDRFLALATEATGEPLERLAHESVVPTLFTVEGGQAAAGELIESGHTAILCGSDMMALGAIRACQARGLCVPADISIVGYDDSPLMAFTDPALTTLRQAVAPMAHAAVTTLIAEIAGTRAPRHEMLYRPELIVRDSTSVARRG